MSRLKSSAIPYSFGNCNNASKIFVLIDSSSYTLVRGIVLPTVCLSPQYLSIDFAASPQIILFLNQEVIIETVWVVVKEPVIRDLISQPSS